MSSLMQWKQMHLDRQLRTGAKVQHFFAFALCVASVYVVIASEAFPVIRNSQ